MQYYRRRPLDLAAGETAKSVSDAASEIVTAVCPAVQGESILPALRMPTANPAAQIASGLPSLPLNSAASTVDSLPLLTPATPGSVLNASELVQRAVAILDQEMAAGLLAARGASGPALPFAVPGLGAAPTMPASLLPTLSALSGQNAELPIPEAQMGIGPEMVEEWMRGVQHLAASFANLVAVSRQNAQMATGVAAHQAGLNTNSRALGREPEDESAPLLRLKGLARPGERATMIFRIVNESAKPAQLTLQCTDLMNHDGYRIPAQRINITPNNVELAPNAAMNVTLTAAIPPALPAGSYSGLLTTPTLSYLHAVVLASVG